MNKYIAKQSGFSLIELLVAVAVFAILAAGVFRVVTNNYSNFYGTGDRQALTEFAKEGAEAVRAIRDNSWQDIENLTMNTDYGVVLKNGAWIFLGSSDTRGAFTRTIQLSAVSRDELGKIVDTGGTVDPKTKKATITVSGNGITDYVLIIYITNWSTKSWLQTDWSGEGFREFWSDASMASSSLSNISTSTVGQLGLDNVAGIAMAWDAWADLIPDSTAKYKAWEDFYNYELSNDGKSLYIIGTTNYDFVKYDISRVEAGIFSPEFKIELPWHTQNVVSNPAYSNYAYIAKRLAADGTDNICVVNLEAISVDTINDCYDITWPGTAAHYAMEMIVNEAGTKLFMFDSAGYVYVFSISDSGATLSLENDAQLISSGAGANPSAGYAINGAYLDESGAEPYMYIVSDDYLGEFRKMGIDGYGLSSTSTYAYVDYSFTSDLTDIEFLETSSTYNVFILGSENTAKEFRIAEDEGSSLTELSSYDLTTSQTYAEVTHDGADMAFVHYYNPGGLYAIDITDRMNPVDGSLSNTTFNKKSNYTTYDQLKFVTSSRGLFVSDHLADNTTELHFIGRDFTRANGGSYDYRRKITLGENSKVSGGPHTDFPVVISETQDYLKTVSNGGKVQNDYGYDIVFSTTSLGTSILDHEIETYSSSTGELVAWIKIPSLTANTDIYMFYGNSNIDSTQENITGVWSNNYQLVTHLNDSGIGGVRSSVHSSNGWFKYASSSPSESAGIIGRGQYFDEDYDYLTIENNPDKAQGYSDFTVEFWMKPDSTATDTYTSPIYFGNGGVNAQDGWLFRRYLSTKKLYFHMGENNVTNLGGFYLDTAAITDNVWTYVAMQIDRDAGYYSYLNTVAKTSCTTAPCDDTTAYSVGNVYDVTIGKDWSSTDFFYKGEVDELRISNDIKSTDWMTTGYNNIYSTSTFYSIDIESPALTYNTPGQLYSSIFDIAASDQNLSSISVEQDVPTGCSIQITLEADNNSDFSTAVSETFDGSTSASFVDAISDTLDGKRWLRYKVDLTACGTGDINTPTLYSVKVDYK